MTQTMRLPGKPRIKRDDVIDALLAHGPCSRAALEKLFQVPARGTSIQTHITNMRDDMLIYISEWLPPETTGMWTPVYDLRRSSKDEDAPHPPPRERSWCKSDPEEFGEPVIVRGVGVKKEHVLLAKTRSEMGLWGDLVTPVQPTGFTRVPRQNGTT